MFQTEKYASECQMGKMICELVLYKKKKKNALVLFLEEVNLGLIGIMIL